MQEETLTKNPVIQNDTVSADTFTGSAPMELPPTQSENLASFDLESTLAGFNAPAPEVQKGTDIQNSITSLMGELGGEAGRQAQLEDQAGLGQQQTELQSVINQLQGLTKEQMALPLQVAEEFTGRASVRQQTGITESRMRQNTIKALGLSAIGQTLQGNIQLAQANIARALEVEFAPKRQELEVLKQQYLFNKDALERVDKKRADNLNIMLGERDRLLRIEETDRNEVYNIGLTARQFGADTATVQKIMSARSREEAVSLAGNSLQDPVAKQQLANAQLDNQLTKLNINKTAYELSLLKEYGGLTPAQYSKKLADEQATINATTDEREKAMLQGESLFGKSTLIQSILDSSGLDSVVGPTPFSRGFGRSTGVIGKTISLGSVRGLVDETTGSADQTVLMTEQFISKEFLQQLIDVKAQGATFGALQFAEQQALTKSAAALGGSRIRQGNDPDGKVIGYDMSEANFKRELENIKNLTDIAWQRATGKSTPPDEQAIFDAIDEASQPFNPSF